MHSYHKVNESEAQDVTFQGHIFTSRLKYVRLAVHKVKAYFMQFLKL